MKKVLTLFVSIVVLLGMVGMAEAYVEGGGGKISLPEPATLLLVGIGIAGLAVIKRKFKG